MKTIHIEFSDERLITPSGLVFVDLKMAMCQWILMSLRLIIQKQVFFSTYNQIGYFLTLL